MNKFAKCFTKPEHMYEYIRGYASWAEEESTPKYLAALDEAYETFCKDTKREKGTFEYISYFRWLEKECESENN